MGKNAVKTQNNAPVNNKQRKRASTVIRKQYKREVSFQINDIKTALVMATNPLNPDRLKLHQIYRYVLRDARLKSQIRDAVMKVLSEPWMLYNKNTLTPNEELSKKYRKKWMNDVIKYIIHSEMHGYSVLEFDKINPETGDIDEITCFDREYVSIEKQAILIEASVNGSYLEYKDIMWDIDLIEFFDTRTDYGLLLEASYNVIWKYYARTDWSRASEKWGMPMLKVLVDTNSDNELDEYEARASNFGADGYYIGQTGDEVDIMQRSGQKMHDIYLDNIKLCNEEFTLLINGQVATSTEKSFVGSSEVQERNFEDLTLTRLQNVSDNINLKLFPYLRYKGFTDITEDVTFDYPALVREREKKIKVLPTLTQAPKPIKEPQPNPSNEE